MQQRQLRLGDILDDYCPRERRVTNHVVVAMIGENVKQTRCTNCDADHEYKHEKVARTRRTTKTPAALAAQGFGAPKLHEHAGKPASQDDTPAPPNGSSDNGASDAVTPMSPVVPMEFDASDTPENGEGSVGDGEEDPATATADEGPVHRRLIRAS